MIRRTEQRHCKGSHLGPWSRLFYYYPWSHTVPRYDLCMQQLVNIKHLDTASSSRDYVERQGLL